MEKRHYIRKVDQPGDKVCLKPPVGYVSTCELLMIRHDKFQGTELCQKWEREDACGNDVWVPIQYCSGDPET